MAQMIAAFDGQRVMSGMIDRIVEQEVARREAAADDARRTEVMELKRELDIKREREARYWSDKIRMAELEYGYNPRPMLIGRVFWGLVGLFVEKVIGPIERGE